METGSVSLGRTDLLSSNRHFASAPVENFLERWEQPNKRNRSYDLRSGADPIATHDYLPPAHPRQRPRPRADRRKLPPSRYGSDDHHVPQILQKEWNGTTSFALDKLHDFRQYSPPKQPFRPATTQTRTDFMISSASNFGGHYKRPQTGQATPAAIAREYDALKRRLYELNAQARRVAGKHPSRATQRLTSAATAALPRTSPRRRPPPGTAPAAANK